MSGELFNGIADEYQTVEGEFLITPPE